MISSRRNGPNILDSRIGGYHRRLYFITNPQWKIWKKYSRAISYVRRCLIAAEALRPKLDPGEQVAIVQFFATPDAVARCVPVRLAEVFPQQTWLPVLDALTVPGSWTRAISGEQNLKLVSGEVFTFRSTELGISIEQKRTYTASSFARDDFPNIWTKSSTSTGLLQNLPRPVVCFWFIVFLWRLIKKETLPFDCCKTSLDLFLNPSPQVTLQSPHSPHWSTSQSTVDHWQENCW